MADKSKQRARALKKKSRMSYQAARCALRRSPTGINIIHTFRWETDPKLKLSERCPSCQRWIHCREHLQEAKCFCGTPYRVLFDRKPDWSMKPGVCCMDCGARLGAFDHDRRRSLWRPMNFFQIRCGVCDERAYHVEHIRWLEERGRKGSLRSIASHEKSLHGPAAEALIAKTRAAHDEVGRFHDRRMKELEKLESDMTADTPIEDPDYRAASSRLCDLMNELESMQQAQRATLECAEGGA